MNEPDRSFVLFSVGCFLFFGFKYLIDGDDIYDQLGGIALIMLAFCLLIF